VHPPQRHGRDDPGLIALLDEVKRCRVRVHEGRQDPSTAVNHHEQSRRCALLADAMEAYADAAAESGVPLPYRYRDEMRLYSAMARGGSLSGREPRP